MGLQTWVKMTNFNNDISFLELLSCMILIKLDATDPYDELIGGGLTLCVFYFNMDYIIV